MRENSTTGERGPQEWRGCVVDCFTVMEINRRQFNCALAVALSSIPARWLPSQATVRVNGQRIMDHLLALAEFGKNPQGGVSRVAYSDADKQGREYVLGLMRAAKLEVSIDAAGNLIGRRGGKWVAAINRVTYRQRA